MFPLTDARVGCFPAGLPALCSLSVIRPPLTALCNKKDVIRGRPASETPPGQTIARKPFYGGYVGADATTDLHGHDS